MLRDDGAVTDSVNNVSPSTTRDNKAQEVTRSDSELSYSEYMYYAYYV